MKSETLFQKYRGRSNDVADLCLATAATAFIACGLGWFFNQFTQVLVIEGMLGVGAFYLFLGVASLLRDEPRSIAKARFIAENGVTDSDDDSMVPSGQFIDEGVLEGSRESVAV